MCFIVKKKKKVGENNSAFLSFLAPVFRIFILYDASFVSRVSASGDEKLEAKDEKDKEGTEGLTKHGKDKLIEEEKVAVGRVMIFFFFKLL